jgi:cytochrome c-type biogenesis protein CcmH/NrfG
VALGLQGHYEQALADFEKYLELAPRASNREQVEAVVRQLRAELERD